MFANGVKSLIADPFTIAGVDLTVPFGYQSYATGDGFTASIVAASTHVDEIHLLKNLALLVIFLPISLAHIGFASVVVFVVLWAVGPWIAVEVVARGSATVVGASGGTFALVGIAAHAFRTRHLAFGIAFVVAVLIHQLLINQLSVAIATHLVVAVIGYFVAAFVTWANGGQCDEEVVKR